MAKWPGFGRCKTRLAKDIGQRKSLIIQRRMFQHTLSVASYLEKEGYLEISLAIDGIGLQSSKRWCKKLGINNFNLQGHGLLGEKIKRQILINHKKYFKFQKRDLIIIGTDLTDLCHLDLLKAISKIKKTELILGPSNDGGYWLIGISKKIISPPFILPFIDIQWSSNNVLQKTIDHLTKKRIKIEYLNSKVDIDLISDLLKQV